jgi:hypothetical protein
VYCDLPSHGHDQVIPIAGTLERTRCFSDENYDTLATKLALHSSRMLRKPDQARLVALCSHLFWSAKTLETAGTEVLYGCHVSAPQSKNGLEPSP